MKSNQQSEPPPPSLRAGYFFMLSSAYFFIQKIFQEQNQDVKLLVVIWIQTVCKCYQQMTKVAAGKE